MDHEPLKKEDLNSQFLASHDNVGKNRAESSLQRLQRLNPMVEVTADTSNLVKSARLRFLPVYPWPVL
jgi:ubiquitin-like 1-activating enzyme E1 A